MNPNLTRRYTPPTAEQIAALQQLLTAVSSEEVRIYKWRSDAGRRFIAEIRRVQLTGVPLGPLCEKLGLRKPAVDAAISYWHRDNTRTPRRKQ